MREVSFWVIKKEMGLPLNIRYKNQMNLCYMKKKNNKDSINHIGSYSNFKRKRQ